VIFLSGATGYLGLPFLTAWGESAAALVRGADASDRATALERRAGVAVEGIVGDVREPRWGLGTQAVDALRGRVSRIVHLGAETTWSARWEQLEATNVLGTAHAVDLATELSVPLTFVSSVFAAYDADQQVGERLVEETARLSKYERSKCRAEWIVEEARRRGVLDAQIVRVAGVVGDSATSDQRRRRFRSPLLRVLGEQQWPIIPIVPTARVDIVPRDLVVETLAEIIRNGSDGPVVRHISLGVHAPTVGALAAEIASVLEQDGRPLRVVPVKRSAILRASALADRFGSGPRATALIGLRYFASSTVYLSSLDFASRLTMSELVQAAGLTSAAGPAAALPTYYDGWLGSS
jgi:nucleoside-diphosphate-sugar epimerase